MKHLAAHLKNHPEIEHVYLDDKNHWVFSPNIHHPHKKHRDEILKVAEEEEFAELEAEEAAAEKALNEVNAKQGAHKRGRREGRQI